MIIAMIFLVITAGAAAYLVWTIWESYAEVRQERVEWARRMRVIRQAEYQIHTKASEAFRNMMRAPVSERAGARRGTGNHERKNGRSVDDAYRCGRSGPGGLDTARATAANDVRSTGHLLRLLHPASASVATYPHSAL